MALSKLPLYRHSQILAGAVTLLLFFLAGCGGPNPVTVPTPTIPTIQFTVIDLKLPAAALNAPVIGSVPDDAILHVSVTFKINQQLLDQMNKKKIQTGQNEDLAGLANKLGISDQEYQKIKSFFGIENATLKLNKLHTNLTVDARAKTFARIFQTHFVIHKLNGRTFFTPAADAPPKLPAFLANQIVAITGLDNYSVAPRVASLTQHLNAVGVRKSPAADCNPLKGTLTTADIAHLYGYDQLYKAGLHGEGLTINLVEIDGLSRGDLQNYLGCVNYQGKISIVDVGNPPSPGPEATVDVEMIAGLAPAANIVDYEADLSNAQTYDDAFTQINDALQLIINNNAKNGGSGSLVSISLGAAESLISQNDMAAIDQSLQILTKAEHMTVFIASGDCGAFTGGSYGDLTVSFPASDPWAVAVGGTAPALDRSNNLIEMAWSDGSNRKACQNQWGTGGGLSQVFKRPQWQDGQIIQNKYTNGNRQLPDISAFAIPIAVYFQNRWTAFVGTSLATPIWASGMALVNEGLIQQTKSFYFGPGIFYGINQIGASNGLHPYYDVTQGNNLYYPATAGWDYATGLGSPNLPVFFNILLAAAKQH